MSALLFYRIIDQLPKGATVIGFWRGESLLHSQFSEMMEMALGKGLQVVMATNGTLISENLSVLTRLHTVSVSIHNPLSFAGLRKLLYMRGPETTPEITATMVEGEQTGVSIEEIDAIADKVRIYKEHTINGVWGKVKANDWPQKQRMCSRLKTDLVIAWDGTVSRCCYAWKTYQTMNAAKMSLVEILKTLKLFATNYPDEVCTKCSQWRGDGRTL